MRRLLPLLLLLPCACHTVNTDTPVDTYLSFLQDVHDGKTDAAYLLLSSKTRDLLAARAKALHGLSGGAVSGDPEALVFSQAVPEPRPNEVKLVRKQGDRATLRVVGTSGQGEVYLLNESKGWRIDLTSGLR